jgi:hypothetical protein
VKIGWLKVCLITGVLFIHSNVEDVLDLEYRFRVLDMLSHKIHINRMIDNTEINDPIEETIFQVVKASG